MGWCKHGARRTLRRWELGGSEERPDQTGQKDTKNLSEMFGGTAQPVGTRAPSVTKAPPKLRPGVSLGRSSVDIDALLAEPGAGAPRRVLAPLPAGGGGGGGGSFGLGSGLDEPLDRRRGHGHAGARPATALGLSSFSEPMDEHSAAAQQRGASGGGAGGSGGLGLGVRCLSSTVPLPGRAGDGAEVRASGGAGRLHEPHPPPVYQHK